MGVRVMRWDNFTVVYGVLFMGTSGFSMKPEGRRPEGFIEATSAHKKVPLYYGKIIPPQLLSPPYSIQFYHTTRHYRVVHTYVLFVRFFASPTVFCYYTMSIIQTDNVIRITTSERSKKNLKMRKYDRLLQFKNCW